VLFKQFVGNIWSFGKETHCDLRGILNPVRDRTVDGSGQWLLG
jgi:hypothetical protein